MGMLMVLLWWIFSVRKLLAFHPRSGSRRRGLAAAMAILVLFLHSSVDYPLRTPALLAVLALMTGILASAAATGTKRQGSSEESPAR
jgi:hypothetical protein